jgi:hypothetical protein
MTGDVGEDGGDGEPGEPGERGVLVGMGRGVDLDHGDVLWRPRRSLFILLRQFDTDPAQPIIPSATEREINHIRSID